jgi:signal transduction histidine kinase
MFFGCDCNKENDEYIICLGKKISDLLDSTTNKDSQFNFIRDFGKIFNGLFLEINEKYQITNTFGDSAEIIGLENNDLPKELSEIIELIYEEDYENFKFIHDFANLSKNVQEFSFRIKQNDADIVWIKELLLLIETNNKKTILALFYNVNEDKEKFIKLTDSKTQLLELANHLEMTREQERKEMAREIHDEIGHALTSLKLDINLLLKKRYLREEKLESRLADMQKHIEDTIRMLQRISAQLRPSILDHFGIIAALEWQAKEFQRQTSIRCKYQIPEEDIDINERKTVAIFRIFQEILTNVARHSSASRVDVFLTTENNILELKVSDNGIGIKREDLESPKSLGLIGMKERANLVEGKLTINSILNIGTTVLLTVPIN